MNRWAIAGCVAIGCTGVLAAEMSTADANRGKENRRRFTKDIVVTLVTPTLNQEVLADLADPGLNGRITVRFSSPPRRKDIIDNQNPVNRLTNKVEFLDSSFRQLPGEPTVRRNEFQFNPLDDEVVQTLAAGQYTLNIKSSLRNRRGRQLNKGLRDFTTTFSVGTDIHAPVLRRISPIHQQTNIGLRQPIVATFNEPIDPTSILSTIGVFDATTNPPTTILGTVSTQRNGFDVVFTPDPCFGYPPKTLIAFQMQGEDRPELPDGTPLPPTTSPVTDVFGNGFARDPGLQWRNNPAIGAQFYESPNGVYDESAAIGLFTMIFETVGVRPAPQAIAPGSSQMSGLPIANPCATSAIYFAPSCFAAGSGIHYTTSNGLGQFSMLGIINRFSQGVVDTTLGSVLANAPVRIGRPSGMVVDRRWDPGANFHTFMYMVDQRTQSVLVLDSRNFSTIGRFTGFVSPRDVTISNNTATTTQTLWTTDFASNQVIGIDLQRFAVNFGGQPGAASPCDAIRDDSAERFIVDVGRGPTGVAAEAYFNNTMIVCNTLSNSISVVNVQNGQVIDEYEVGSTPVDVDYITTGFGAFRFALVANQGGANQPDGSISLYAAGVQNARDGIENTFTDNVKNPSSVWGHQEWINLAGNSIPGGREWMVPNTGGDTVVEYTWAVTGGFGIAISASPGEVYEVGLNPTTAMYDPFYPAQFLVSSVAGLGAVAVIDYGRPVEPGLNAVPGVQRLFSAFSH